MIIYYDTRQKKGKHDKKHQQIMSMGYELQPMALKIGDYMIEGNNAISVDTKQNLGEVYSNIVNDKSRFMKEVRRAFEIKGKYWRCYSHCGNGDTISFVQKLFGLSFPDTLKKIDLDFGLNLYGEHTFDEIRRSHYKQKQIQAERERKKREKEQAENEYWAIFDEWIRLDRNKTLYAPKTPDEEWHPLFVEALQKLAYQEYLLDMAEIRRCNV